MQHHVRVPVVLVVFHAQLYKHLKQTRSMADKSSSVPEKTESIEDMKRLSPEERLKKLRELQEKRRKEIEEAQKLLKESEEELRMQKGLEEKIPIPQVTAEQEETLTSTEEKEVFTQHRLKVASRKATETKKKEVKEETLEQAVAEEAPRFDQAAKEDSTAILELSQRPVDYFRNVFEEVTRRTYNAGGMQNLPEEERRRFVYMSASWDRKVEAIESNRYEPTQEAFKAAVLVERLRDKLKGMYQSQATGKESLHIALHTPVSEEQEHNYRRAA